MIHVAQIADRTGDMGGARMEHGTDEKVEPGNFYPWRLVRLRNPAGSIFRSHVSATGMVEAYVCRRCGFTELYTRDPASIPIDGETTRLIQTPEPPPYR